MKRGRADPATSNTRSTGDQQVAGTCPKIIARPRTQVRSKPQHHRAIEVAAPSNFNTIRQVLQPVPPIQSSFQPNRHSPHSMPRCRIVPRCLLYLLHPLRLFVSPSLRLFPQSPTPSRPLPSRLRFPQQLRELSILRLKRRDNRVIRACLNRLA